MQDRTSGVQPADSERIRGHQLISQKVSIKSFCKSQFPHTSVNLSFSVTDVKDTLIDLCGNRHVQNDSINTFCEIRALSLKTLNPGQGSLLEPSRLAPPHQSARSSHVGQFDKPGLAPCGAGAFGLGDPKACTLNPKTRILDPKSQTLKVES